MSEQLERVATAAEVTREARKVYAEAVAGRNAAIAEALAAGESQIPIAAAGQVSQATISRIERGAKGADDE